MKTREGLCNKLLIVVMASADELLAPIINDNNNETTKEQLQETPSESSTTATAAIEPASIEEEPVTNGDLNENRTTEDGETKDTTTTSSDSVDTVDGPCTNNDPCPSPIEASLDNIDTEPAKETTPEPIPTAEVVVDESPADEEFNGEQLLMAPEPVEKDSPDHFELPSSSASSDKDSPLDRGDFNDFNETDSFDKSVSPIEIAENVISDTGDDVVENDDVVVQVPDTDTAEANDISNDSVGETIDCYHPAVVENGLQPDESQACDVFCKLCQNKFVSPRVLTCLHVFCGGCIEKIMVDEAGDLIKTKFTVTCPICKQLTKVSLKFC